MVCGQLRNCRDIEFSAAARCGPSMQQALVTKTNATALFKEPVMTLRHHGISVCHWTQDDISEQCLGISRSSRAAWRCLMISHSPPTVCRKPASWRCVHQIRQSLILLTLLAVFPPLLLAQSGSPFDTGFTALQTLFTGTIAKVASLIAIVIGGYSSWLFGQHY